MQSNNVAKIIKIPALNNHTLCPVLAIRKLLQKTPNNPNSPLFQIKLLSQWVPLTDTRARKHLKSLLQALDLTESRITFHTLRRSGATLAFNAKVPVQDIQSHGTWTSECVWYYITQDHNASDTVALTFQQLLN